MAGEEPPYLSVGTDVSAKYKGAFCEAKVKKVVRSVKCKVTFKNNLGTLVVADDHVKGTLRVGAHAEVKHPEKNQYFEAVINKLHDQSQYTVVFDDGDETTLRRTSLCLKSGRHFAESETLDQLPLTHPEHFGTPVIGSKGRKRRSLNRTPQEEESSDGDSPPKKKEAKHREPDPDVGKVVCVEVGEKKKMKDNWFPALVVSGGAQDAIKINPREEYLVRSFKDGKYHCVMKKETKPFTWEIGAKVDNNTLKTAVEKASLYTDRDELPPHWDRDILFGANNSDDADSNDDSDSDTSDDEPSEEKDRFVAQLYKFMDDRGTPINKAPTVSNRDLNLCRLFKLVQKLGGYNRVTNHMQWKTVYTKMGLPGYSTSSSHQIKAAYKKYLHSFEDFYRKLGCTMGTSTRSGRMRHRTGRSFILTRDRDREFKAAGRRLAKQEAKKKEEKVPKEAVEEKAEPVEDTKEKESEKLKEAAASEVKVERDTEGSDKAKTKDEKKPKLKKEKQLEKKMKVEKEKEEKPKIKGRKKSVKDDNGNESKEQESTDEDETYVEIDIHVGDKVRVKYGRGRHQKIYEAKALEVEEEDGEKHFYVHYTGWNMRYDEWVKRHRIVENLSQKARKGRSAGSPKNMNAKQGSAPAKRGRPPTAQGKPGSQKKASSLSSPRSRSTRSDKNSLAESPFASGLEPRKRLRKSSGPTKDSESDDDDDDDDDSDNSDANSIDMKKESVDDGPEKESDETQQDDDEDEEEEELEKMEIKKAEEPPKKSAKKPRKSRMNLQLSADDDVECDGDIDDDDEQESTAGEKKKKKEDLAKKGKRRKKGLDKEQVAKPEQPKPRRRSKKVKVEEVSDSGSTQENADEGDECRDTVLKGKSATMTPTAEVSDPEKDVEDNDGGGRSKTKRKAKKRDTSLAESDKNDTLNESVELSEKDTSVSSKEIDESFSAESVDNLNSTLDTSGCTVTESEKEETTLDTSEIVKEIGRSPLWEKETWEEPKEPEKKDEEEEKNEPISAFEELRSSTPVKTEPVKTENENIDLAPEEPVLPEITTINNELVDKTAEEHVEMTSYASKAAPTLPPMNEEVIENVSELKKDNIVVDDQIEVKPKHKKRAKEKRESEEESNEVSETESDKKPKSRSSRGSAKSKRDKMESIEEVVSVKEIVKPLSLLADVEKQIEPSEALLAVKQEETVVEKLETVSNVTEVNVESQVENDIPAPCIIEESCEMAVITALTEMSSPVIAKVDNLIVDEVAFETCKLTSLNEVESSPVLEAVEEKYSDSAMPELDEIPIIKDEPETSSKTSEGRKKTREEKKSKDDERKSKEKQKKTKKSKAKKDDLLFKCEKDAEKRESEKAKKKEGKKKKESEKKKQERMESDLESLDSLDFPRKKDKRRKNKQEEKKKDGEATSKKKSRKKGLKDHKTSEEKTSDEDSKDNRKSGKRGEKLGKVKKKRDKNKKDSTSDEHEGKSKPEKEHSKKSEKRLRQDTIKQTIEKFIHSVKPEPEIDEVTDLLICRENVPMSPVAGDVQSSISESTRHRHPSYLSETQFSPHPATMNLVSQVGSSSSSYVPLNLRVCEGESSFNAIFKHEQESSTVLDNTPPTTPDSALSSLSGSTHDCDSGSPPRDEESNKSGQEAMNYMNMRSNYDMNKLVCHEHVDFAQSEAAMVLGSLGVQGYDKRMTVPSCSNLLTKRSRSDFADGSPKKKRRSRRRSHSSNDTGKDSINSLRHDHISSLGHKMTASDSDEVVTSETPGCSGYPMPIFSSSNSSSCSVSSYGGIHDHDRLRLSVMSSHSMRPSKFNFFVELDDYSDASQRISVLQDKLTDLRKTYMALKAEVASIDRRRKKLRKKEKEAASSSTPVSASTGEIECS